MNQHAQTFRWSIVAQLDDWTVTMSRNITQHDATRKAGSEDSDTHRAQNTKLKLVYSLSYILS